jgi:hypothetical protein
MGDGELPSWSTPSTLAQNAEGDVKATGEVKELAEAKMKV